MIWDTGGDKLCPVDWDLGEDLFSGYYSPHRPVTHSPYGLDVPSLLGPPQSDPWTVFLFGGKCVANT